jgi:hypothetical protein
MKDAKVLSFAGACGVIAGVLLLVASPLYLVMGTPPSLGNETLFFASVRESEETT